MSNQSWLKKYEPKLVDHIVGQERAIKEINDFLVNYKTQKKKAALLIGPIGSGKTSSVLTIARHHGWDVIEVNASDTRNAEEIESKIGAAAKQASLFFRGKVILVDEVDGISGQYDRGGIPTLVKIIESTAFPVVMTATDVDDSKFSPIKKVSKTILFDQLSPDSVASVLQRVCQGEGVVCEDLALSSLSRRCGGDLRAAVNDLQALTQDKRALTVEIIKSLDDRNRIEPIQSALIKIFKVSDAKIADSALESVGEDLDESLLWIDENLPKEYDDPASLARAYESIAKADVFRGRIRRWQHWRFLVYVNALITAGLAVAKDQRKKVPIAYERSKRLLSIYIMNMKFAKRKAIAAKLAKATHSSSRRALQDAIPFLRAACRKSPDFAKSFAEQCELDDEELDWLMK